MENIGFAFILTLIAGLSTGFGSLIALISKKTNTKFLSIMLGFSAGVMIYVSMIEIFQEANHMLGSVHGEKLGNLLTIGGFFAGIALIGVIDWLIPDEKNPHEVKSVEDMKAGSETKANLLRTGMFTALAVGIHNFPEGLATFVSALSDPSIAIPIVFAIAIHNIPEGIAVSVPIFYATGDRKKAFIYSFLSGLAEPIGALVGFLILMPFLNDTLYGLVFAFVAGIMVFISLDELLPAAREYGENHLAIAGVIGGMLVMSMSLWIFI
ncbi:MAG TPA: zinc transporter ZupT [Firmicutes bacterium]|nr:zinc transporter ZupT [Bacillota bacterium]